MIYYVLFGLVAVAAVALLFPLPQRSRVTLVVALLATMVVFGGLRDGVGTDWVHYQGKFDQIRETFTPLSLQADYLFRLLTWVVERLTGSYHAFVFVVFLLAFGFKAWLMAA